jgi:hypothetical protein
MISIYSAPNTLDAHMVLDLLEQAGIQGTTKNEHLQGIERLNTGGFVKIYVEENNVDNASKIIADMQNRQSETEKTSTLPTAHNNPLKYFVNKWGRSKIKSSRQ